MQLSRTAQPAGAGCLAHVRSSACGPLLLPRWGMGTRFYSELSAGSTRVFPVGSPGPSLAPHLCHKLKKNHWCFMGDAASQWWDKKVERCSNTLLVPSIAVDAVVPSLTEAHEVEKCGVNKEVTLLLQIILTGPDHSPHVSSCFLEKAFLKWIL